MQLYKTVSAANIKESISQLQQTARSYRDIASWFRVNLHAIGLPQPVEIDDVSSSVYYDIGEIAANACKANPFVRSSLKIMVTNSGERHPVLDNMFYVHGDANSDMKANLTLELYMEDWPLLAADLAASFFNDALDHIDEEDKPNIEHLLTTWIPRHFHGLSWESLKVMAETDLLPTSRGDYEDEFIEFLFNHVGAVAELPLPDTYAPCP